MAMSYAQDKKKAAADGDRAPHDLPPNYVDIRPDTESGRIAVQAGVRKIEGISQSWTGWWLWAAYIGILLMAVSTALESSTSYLFTYYATSSFSASPYIAVIGIVQGVILSVIKPPMAKISDVVGRTEAYCIAVLLYILGYIQQAASRDFPSFASAQIFYSAGSTGVQVLQQIFVADISNLLNRALFSTLPDIPFLWSPWAGPAIAADLGDSGQWRWGYGLWAITLPVCFMPLLLALVLNERKARKQGLIQPRSFPRLGNKQGLETAFRGIKQFVIETDLFGLMLLGAGIALILLPLALAPLADGQWSNPSMIAMIVIGFVSLILFAIWERIPRLSPYAFFPRDLAKQPTVLAGCGIAFFYFMAFYLSVYPYYQIYLRVVPQIGSLAVGHIISTFNFTSVVSSIVVSFFIKYTGHYKYFVTAGSCIYLMGMGLMVRYRREDASIGSLVGCQIAVGIGGGFLNVPAQLGVQASASHGQVAAATAVFLTILEVGGACGNAISGAIWSSFIPRKLAQYVPPEDLTSAMGVFLDPTTIPAFPKGTATRIAIDRAYQETMTTILTVGLCTCVPLIPLSLCMKNYKLDQMDQKVKGRVFGGFEDTTEKSEGLNPIDPAAATGSAPELRRERRGWPMSMFMRNSP